jgi:hypothetical protein
MLPREERWKRHAKQLKQSVAMSLSGANRKSAEVQVRLMETCVGREEVES